MNIIASMHDVTLKENWSLPTLDPRNIPVMHGFPTDITLLKNYRKMAWIDSSVKVKF